MYFPLILAMLVIVSAVFLLRQYWRRELAGDDNAAPDLFVAHRDDPAGSRDALKAA